MSDKFLLDGQPPTSYTYEPHLGPSYDMPAWNPDTLKKVVKELHRAGHQLAFHVMGDAAIDLALDVLEEALQDFPREDHRHRLEHVMIPTEASIQRMKELGIRSTSGGTIIAPEQRITIQEALRAHTMDSAYAAFKEDVKGSIEVGKYADMTIWSDDLYTVPVSEMPNLWVRGVIVGGTVYENPNVEVEDNSPRGVPDNLNLYYSYPNPFNSSTNIVYNLKESGFTTLRIYNSMGQLVKTLVNQIQIPGKYVIRWDATDSNDKQAPSGQYYFQLAQGNHIIIKKAILLK